MYYVVVNKNKKTLYPFICIERNPLESEEKKNVRMLITNCEQNKTKMKRNEMIHQINTNSKKP